MFDDGLNDYAHNDRRRSALVSLDRLLLKYGAGRCIDGAIKPYQGFEMPMLAIRVTSEGQLQAYRRWPGIRPQWRVQEADSLNDRHIGVVIDALRKELGYVPRHGF